MSIYSRIFARWPATTGYDISGGVEVHGAILDEQLADLRLDGPADAGEIWRGQLIGKGATMRDR
ncbi:hypothetical protein AB0B57_30435 [Micromonospora sp. NPDC049101]|uniref:hypothetical protein n=1 Tax=unclassified Micromonospora TaxID=2617518 RepID=UPI00340325DF